MILIFFFSLDSRTRRTSKTVSSTSACCSSRSLIRNINLAASSVEGVIELVLATLLDPIGPLFIVPAGDRALVSGATERTVLIVQGEFSTKREQQQSTI